jgi:hypothetical protein
MTHDERICEVCSDAQHADDSEVWRHVALFVVLLAVGFAIGYWHP